MVFEWDENKNKSNIEKHNIDFETAQKVFNDVNKIEISIENSTQQYGEQRNMVIGIVVNLVYAVVYTLRGSIYRIISARRANRNERILYQQLNH